MKIIAKLLLMAVIGFTAVSCSEKTGMEKIKEGVEDVSDDAAESIEEASSKKIKIQLK